MVCRLSCHILNSVPDRSFFPTADSSHFEFRASFEFRFPSFVFAITALIVIFLQMAPKMRFNSLASRHKTRASSANEGSAVEHMRRKNMLSLDSLRHVPMLFLKSLPETASVASQKFAPTLVPAPTN